MCSDIPLFIGIEPGSPALQADALPSELPGPIILSIPFIYLSTYEESGEDQFYHHLFRLISLGKLNFLYCILSLYWFLLNLPTEFIIQLIQCFLVLNLPLKKKCLLVFWCNSQALILEHTQHGTFIFFFLTWYF